MEKVTQEQEKISPQQSDQTQVSETVIEDTQETNPRQFHDGARYIAIRLLNRFERSDSYVDKLLEREYIHSNLNPFDKALLTEIVYGVIRWKAKLDWILTGFYRGDYQKCLNIVKNAMRVALYQIIFLNKIPAHAAINESVEIIKNIQSEKTAGIVNGVLRNIVRNQENVRYPDRQEDIVYYFSIIYSHPKWIVKRWIERYGVEETEKILTYNNHRPNLPLRINTFKSNFFEVTNFLKEKEIVFYKTAYMENSLRLKTSKANVLLSDIFETGKVTVQDTSASLACRLAAPQQEQYVIDLCAAPGGKSIYLAELMKDSGNILAIDKYSSKLHLIEENAERLGINSITTLMADSTEYEPEEQADLVFTDVPCSGLGTLSKRPDIKWKREVEDIVQLVKLQREILSNAAKIVKPGGVLLYSTCTIEPEENIENARWFLENFPEYELDPAEKYIHHEVCKDGYMQTYPHINYCDGAFAARFVKRS